MKQVLRIRDEKTRMKVTPLLAVAPIMSKLKLTCTGTQDDDIIL